MASSELSKAGQNFTCCAKACIDVIKLPLVDILTDRVKPVDLYVEITSSSTLMQGKNKLRPDQLKLCFFPLPLLPDYSKFDVTLLYTLIRNLCPKLKPTSGWGVKPNSTNTKIGDDIERLRLIRNNTVAHASSAEISDNEFNNLWNDMQSVVQRIETFTKTWSTTNYEEELTRIKNCKFGYDDRDHYKLLLEAILILLKSENIDEAEILITGEDNVVCGDIARFDAKVNRIQLSEWAEWSITWQIKMKDITKTINTRDEKYKGSNRWQLVIQSVCKDDEGEYQAVFSNGRKLNTISNTIYLEVLGEHPVFDVWRIVTDKGAITIEYRYSVPQHLPQVSKEQWTKNGEALDRIKNKYLGGQMHCNYFMIMSPSLEDKGNYSCTVTNAVGSVSKDVEFDVPFAHISTDSKGYFGSMTVVKSVVKSCPKIEGIEWQCSGDGKKFFHIDISKPHYHGSKIIPESPLLVISKTNFEDSLHYRLHVWNKIGESFSNVLYINVIGSPPNIMTTHETCFENHSVKLIGKVFPHDQYNAITHVFWTKNQEKIDTLNSEEKYSKVSPNDSSLTIYEVNEHDAGSYQLTAINEVGSTCSDVIVLDMPRICVKRRKHADGCQVFTALIQSIPAAYQAQWKVKRKDEDTFKPVDGNAEEYRGTTNSLPRPVLVLKNKRQLQNQCFKIEVDNFVGSGTTEITGNENPEIVSDKVFKTGSTRTLPCDIFSNTVNKNGSTIRFNNLRRNVIKGLKQSDLQELMDSFEIITERKVRSDVKSIGDFFRHLLEEGVLNKSNVIILQCLLRAIDRPDLEELCVKYATTDKPALCYYEDFDSQDVPKVYLHVVDDIEYFTETEPLLKTVASIVGCTFEDIKIVGFQPANSFIIIISMKEELLNILWKSNPLNLQRLLHYNVDWIEIEDKILTGCSPSMTRSEDILLREIGRETGISTFKIREKRKIVLLETSSSDDTSDEEQMSDMCKRIVPVALLENNYPFYIVYSSKDALQALKICINLERRFHFKWMLSCLGNQTGYLRFKNSYNFIKKSDNVLLLLSNGFLAEPWCTFETKLAVHSKKKIVNILFRDLTVDRDLPQLFKHFVCIDAETEHDFATEICQSVCYKDTNKSTDHPKFGEKYNQNDLGNFEMHMDFRASQEEYNYEVRPEVSPGQLYTDEEFPLSVAMGKDYNQELLKWKRPFEFAKNPCLFSEGTTCYDIGQGSIGTCWFLSSVANVADKPKLLRRIIPHDSYPVGTPNYDGIFHCRFWRFGIWEDVFIDDCLPIIYGNQIYYARSSTDQNEMWVSLLEKAFAKMYGSYTEVSGGVSSDSYMALTGGVSEDIDLRELNMGPDQLHKRVKNALSSGAAVTCGTPSTFKKKYGLLGGHEYIINGAITAKGVRLFRLRNQWGKTEWIGPYSDGSPEWQSIQGIIEGPNKDDGEFYISLDHFLSLFNTLTICNITPDFDSEERSDSLKYCTCLYGKWQGEEAGGFQNRIENPKFQFEVDEQSVDQNGIVPFVVQLIQRTKQRKAQNLRIRVDLYRVLENASEDIVVLQEEGIPSKNYTYTYSERTQISFRFSLKPGKYVCIPSTISESQEQEFMLRLYSAGPLRDMKKIKSNEVTIMTCSGEDASSSYNVKCVTNRWRAGLNAGGQVSHRTFHRNPQIRIDIPTDQKVKLELLVDSKGPIGVKLFKLNWESVPVGQDWLYEHYPDALRTTDGDEGPFVIGSFTPAVYYLEAGSYVCLLHMDEPDTEKRFALVIRSQTPLCNIELHHME